METRRDGWMSDRLKDELNKSNYNCFDSDLSYLMFGIWKLCTFFNQKPLKYFNQI